MNNKGYLLVEIIVASVIAMSMMYFLLEITIKLKNINEDYYVETKLETDQILMLRGVMNDLSSYELKKVYVNNNIVDFTFNDGTDDFVKRITIEIESKTYKYGKLNSSLDYLDDVYVKSFDKNLNVKNIEIENLCYHENEYKDCNELGTSTVSKGLLKINIPATTIYSDIDYGINLNIPYNTKDISIYVSIEPVISSKGDNFTIDEGDNYNVIEEYFTYDTNGGKDIVNKQCLVNNTTEITETSDLSAGTYNISCSVTNDDNLTASASTTLTVNEKVKFTYISAKSSGNAYTTSVVYKNNAFIREFNNSGVTSAIGCTTDTCYISAQSSSNAYSTTVVYKDGSFEKEFNNSGVTKAIGCTIDTCYISAQSSSNAYTTTVVYKDGSFVKEFNNSGVTSAIGCTTDTCYISAQSSGNAYSTTVMYKDGSFVKEFDNSGVVTASGGNNH